MLCVDFGMLGHCIKTCHAWFMPEQQVPDVALAAVTHLCSVTSMLLFTSGKALHGCKSILGRSF